jgi:4-hydroxy-2-oxovalerate aldolase
VSAREAANAGVLAGTRIEYCDSTLRDGSHPKSHRFTVDEVRDATRALDLAGVPWIEVSHGDGLGGSSLTYGLSETDEFTLMRAALGEMTIARLAVLLLPGIGTRDDLSRAYDTGARLVRIATHSTEADIAEEHIGLARHLGMTTVGFLMMAHLTEPERLAREASIMAHAGAQVVYITDSAGAMLPGDVTARVAALRAALPSDVEIGFHGHHNLALGVANSIAAIEVGARWIDGSTCGLGAGAGNTPTEVFVAVCDRMGIDTGIDVMKIADAAEDVVRPILDRPVIIDRSSLILGYAGVYSSFLLHAERASERFGVPTRDILLEVARRKAVGGQEDLILEIAAGLAASTGGLS